MASAGIDNRRFFCHSCQGEVPLNSIEFTCSLCDSGCIEELETFQQDISFENNYQSGPARSRISDEDHFRNVRENTNYYPTVPNHPRRRRHAGNAVHVQRNRPGGQGNAFMVHISSGGNGPIEVPGGNGDMDMFFNQFFNNLGMQAFRGTLHGSGISGSFGDYAWGPNGLDNIITQLLNQLDNTGPPPADKDKINSLPINKITQRDVDNHLDCAVCQDKYKLGEKTKRLPCAHAFHPACVDPWLEMHDSCPVCRCDLNGNRPSDET